MTVPGVSFRRYREVRALTAGLCEPLEVDDYAVRSMPEARPAKWHLAHTTWFWEARLLQPHLPGYQPFHPQFAALFGTGRERVPQDCRGVPSRPTTAQITEYRRHVDDGIQALFQETDPDGLAALRPLIELGLNHEQQHQELLIADLKHLFGTNPLRPAYREPFSAGVDAPPLCWFDYSSGLRDAGWWGDGFCFPEELPRHPVYVGNYRLASRLVTCGEYLEFMADGGYDRPELWPEDGWAHRNQHGWRAPLYWEERDGEWWAYSLGGLRPVDPAEPVCHLSFHEAFAYAAWAGARLPTEFEWELAAESERVQGNLLSSGRFHPAVAPAEDRAPVQLYGDVWEWTGSAALPYPGARPRAEAAEPDRFSCGRMVLRGGSCATPEGHLRPTYRRFLSPDARWQFTGVRLAQTVP